MSAARRVAFGLRMVLPVIGAFIEDVILVAGGAMVAYGVWRYSEPAGFIAAGVLLIAGTILKARGAPNVTRR